MTMSSTERGEHFKTEKYLCAIVFSKCIRLPCFPVKQFSMILIHIFHII